MVGVFTLLIVMHIINGALDGRLNQFGVIPRSIQNWYHIGIAPFVHGSSGHLLNNLVGLGIFGTLCALRSVAFFVSGSLFIIILGGSLVWVFGRDAVHIGASGWVFGLWSLCIAMAWFDRSLLNVALAVVVIFLYGGMILGVLPTDPRVSFESHLFGLCAGIIFAFVYTRLAKKNNRPLRKQWRPR
jgi:membrane associated rhomboid family serine protease